MKSPSPTLSTSSSPRLSKSKYYFNKFGKDGVILSPSDSFEEMRTLYVEGAERITEKLRCENINENYSKKRPYTEIYS